MPEEGKVCEVDAHPYGNTTWDDVIGNAQNDSKPLAFKRDSFY